MNLIAAGISKSYGDTVVLSGLDICAEQGESVAVTGPSGSGKSTLLHILGALDPPDTGSVRIGDITVKSLDDDGISRFRATQVGFVFQEHLLLPQLSAIENILLPALAAEYTGLEERAYNLLQRVGLTSRRDAFPVELSGGERQRVSVARALINSPRLLLCDEPTGNLDEQAGRAVIELILELGRAEEAVTIIVTHNLGHASLCDRALVLREGRLVSS